MSEKSIFLEALEMADPAERSAYLDRACGEMPQLRGRVETLLAAHFAQGSFLNAPATGLAATVNRARVDETILGDYRIVREVGRGGMGVVYEAEQISLGRRVALKVMPFAAALDARQLQRFKNEAHAAAQLHHTNIVPVYGVGHERGTHFYAMQFIEGQNLDAIIREQRGLSGRPVEDGHAESPTASKCDAQATGTYAPGEVDLSVGPNTKGLPGGKTSATETSNAFAAALSTERSSNGPAYFQTIARWGAQAAAALEHAHEVGVVHRDIKPANLLIDTRGNLWITDFGLAFWQNQPNLTMTGALIGTLRYMSPEQALAKRVLVDHRTDIYSLGVTLYELLTLEHAFEGRDRQDLLRQIAFEEPKALRARNRAIPTELETIILKAMAKNPADRYDSAQEMADDLERFLKNEPIRARRPSLLKKVRMWVQRHRTLARTATAFSVVIVLILAVTGWQLAEQQARNDKALADQQRRDDTAQAERKSRNEAAVRLSLKEADLFRKTGKLPEAIGAAKQAHALVQNEVWDAELPGRAAQLLADLQMIARVEDIRGHLHEGVVDGPASVQRTIDAYAAAFRDYGVHVEELTEERAAAALRQSAIRVELSAALDMWILAVRSEDTGKDKGLTERWQRLLRIAQTADLDAFRIQVRQGLAHRDVATLKKLAADPKSLDMPAATLDFLGLTLIKNGEPVAGLAVLREAQERYPDDFWINSDLGTFFRTAGTPRFDYSVRYTSAALALRPNNAGAYCNLGLALNALGDHAEAVAALRKAVALKPDWYVSHFNLALALHEMGNQEEAAKELELVNRLEPTLPSTKAGLARIYVVTERYDEAIRTAREAIAAYQKSPHYHPRKDFAGIHFTLGQALLAKGDAAQAVHAFQKAAAYQPGRFEFLEALVTASHRHGTLDEYLPELDKQPNSAAKRHALGIAKLLQKDYRAATAQLEAAAELDGNTGLVRYHLGLAHFEQGNIALAFERFQQAAALQPGLAKAHYNIGAIHHGKKEWGSAVAAYDQAIKFEPKYAEAYYAKGNTLNAQKNVTGAIAAYKKAIDIKPDFEIAHCNLGNCLRLVDNFDEALIHLQKAVTLDPKDSIAFRFLGHAQKGKGNFDEAAAAYEQALRLNRSDKMAQEHLKLIQPEQQRARKLAEVMAGKTWPANAMEAIQLAQHCHQYRKLPMTEARLYKDAFTVQPELALSLRAGLRYRAACAALQAGCGKGGDAELLNAQERTAWRKQALAWLQDDWKACQALFDAGQALDTFMADKILTQWQANPELAVLRDVKESTLLSAAEKQAWHQLWTDVDTLRAQTNARFGPPIQRNGALNGQLARQVHELKLQKDRTYIIDLTSGQFDTYLIVLNDQGKKLAEDDDGGEGLNSRLLFVPPNDGNYRLVVTSYDQQGSGPYTLSVQEFTVPKK